MNLHVVLVRTESSGNIGAAARALANMGGTHLILVDPRCEVDESARQMAAGARDALAGRTVYPDWNSFYASEGEGVRIALTRRTGRRRKVFDLREKLREIPAPESLYLIFGPEADGLDADDLAYVNYSCHLPVHGEFGSLNLAQAVMLALYLARETFPPETRPRQLKGEEETPVQPFYFPDKLIKEWLTAMGFDVSARRASAYLTLRRLFLQNLPTRHELQVLEAILQQNIRKLKGSVGLTAEELADDLSDVPVEDV